MRNPFRVLSLLIALLSLLAGCVRDHDLPVGSELDDPHYLRGQQLAKQGRTQQALAEYLKVIAKRGETAPESHLEAGLINLQHLKDPIAAIYYFRKYLELQPNSKQAELVRPQIDAATREFARRLPTQPLENAAERLEYTEQLARLQRENEQLRQELALLRGGRSIDQTSPVPRPRPLLGVIENPSIAIIAAPETIVESSVPPPPGSRPALAPSVKSPPPPSPARGRVHVVQPSESLYAIARKYYGNAGLNAKTEEIFNANRDVMQSRTDVKPGMHLRIP